MQIYFHSRLCSYLSRVPILVEGTVYTNMLLKTGFVLQGHILYIIVHAQLTKYIQIFIYMCASFKNIFLVLQKRHFLHKCFKYK